MQLTTDSFRPNSPIPADYAFCSHDPANQMRFAGNRNPQFTWKDLPVGTKSLVLICHDPDAPSSAEDVNQKGRTVPAELPRVDFYHWILVDLRPNGEIAAGEFCDSVTLGGKSGPEGPRGTRQGVNDYTHFLAGEPDLAGKYFGYDGPCPPWNDSIPHRYVFTLYALDVERCPVDGEFNGAEVIKAIEGHVLGTAGITGSYSTNPDVPA